MSCWSRKKFDNYFQIFKNYCKLKELIDSWYESTEEKEIILSKYKNLKYHSSPFSIKTAEISDFKKIEKYRAVTQNYLCIIIKI